MTERPNRHETRASRASDAARTQRPGRSGDAAARPFPVWKAIAALALIVAVVFVAQLCATAATIDVTVNGTTYTLHGAKTVQTAIKESGIPVNPGDYISLRGQVLERKGGHPFYATVNGVETTDPDQKLHNGDTVTLADGEDIVEDYTSTYEPIDFSAVTEGAGCLYVLKPGVEGTMEVRTGSVTGEVVRKWKDDPQDVTRVCYDPNVGDDKVIALTFDDGPSSTCTNDILDILAENDAKATFFWVGSEINGEVKKATVRRAQQEGHQLCTHTYSFDQTVSSFDYSTLSTDEQVSQIVDGYKAISDVTGVEPSHAVRLPGGMMNNIALLNVSSYITAEIGWTIDTNDYKQPGVQTIYEQIIAAQPGDVILCHDTAASEQTVEALRDALPYLKEAGYRFITIDQMLAYPAKDAEASN